MAKESLFNILNNWFELNQIEVLDLFAGTGNISYEFASRGAITVTSVDNNTGCIKFMQKIAGQLGYEHMQIVRADAMKFIERGYKSWDVIFADPPYDFDKYQQIPELVFGRELLSEKGILVIEHGQDTDFSEHPKFLDMRKYGSVHFSFLGDDVAEEE